MPTTDTTEKGLESLIVNSLTGEPGYVQGDPRNYDRDHAIDLAKLMGFLHETQPNVLERLGIAEDGPKRSAFLARLQGEVAKRGVIDVLRHPSQNGNWMTAGPKDHWDFPTSSETKCPPLGDSLHGI
jgi:type I restriction enzyme, R subunit